MANTNAERLDRIHADLQSVRSLLQRPAKADPAEMLEHLRSAVGLMSAWAQPPVEDGPPLGELEEIRDSLRQMQPLFDNARSLQQGWADIVTAEYWTPYDSRGGKASSPMSGASATQIG